MNQAGPAVEIKHTHTHRRDVNGAIYRGDVAGMEFRCVLEKSETGVCVHDVLKRRKTHRKSEINTD